MSNEDQLLFWLSQEPVDSIADLYLPPDTPTQSARVFSQIRKNKRIKKTRTIERLKAYTLEKLQDTRKDQARTVIPASLPRPITPYEVIEFIEGEDFLVDYTEDIVELLEMARRVKENGKESVLLNPPPLPTTAEEEEEANLPEKIEYKSKIEKDYNSITKVYLEQYDRIMIELLNEEGSSSSINALPSLLSPQREEVEAESDSSLSPIITTSPLPPLPPRVSRRDPRLTLKEYNSNNTSHQSPTNIK